MIDTISGGSLMMDSRDFTSSCARCVPHGKQHMWVRIKGGVNWEYYSALFCIWVERLLGMFLPPYKPLIHYLLELHWGLRRWIYEDLWYYDSFDNVSVAITRMVPVIIKFRWHVQTRSSGSHHKSCMIHIVKFDWCYKQDSDTKTPLFRYLLPNRWKTRVWAL